MKRLRELFYVHTSLSLAVMLCVGALIEVLCGAALGGVIQLWVANPAAAIFVSVALCQVWGVIRFERKYR